ncbi:gibberellin 2-beta-dioxygenase 1-like [Nymphaea colorata]|nr:gibberellin 2-beta-dioxygenase 1-like [Nymphaea colorata]
MVVLSNPVLDHLPLTKNQKPTNSMSLPIIDLSMSDSNTMILKACEEFGFFRAINHGIPKELISRLEEETAKFFSLPLSEKEKAGPAKPFGYGNRRIGPNGDVGWLEYLLLQAHPQFISQFSLHVSKKTSSFCEAINAYTFAVRGLACQILEQIAEELKIEPRNTFSQYLMDKQSDSVFRLNHYPPCPALVDLKYKLIGFGEHTDPQILTVLRSNNTAGLEICLRDGSWLPVPPDPNSVIVNVGDAMQALTNGKFRSVKHRVVANSKKSRLSMIYFGAPSLTAKVAPLPLFLRGEKAIYQTFTWYEYKKAAYASRLSDNRLDLFRTEEKEAGDTA